MSYNPDYQLGQQFGEQLGDMRSRAALRDADDALSSWMAYARRLERQLAQGKSELAYAQLNLVRARAGETANNEVLRELRQHILTANPHDPMVQPGVVVGKIRNRIREEVERQGYRVVNPDTVDIAAT